MNFDNIDASKLVDQMRQAVDASNEEMSEHLAAKTDYRAQLDNCVFQTRDLLLKMQEESERESKLNAKRFWINLFISLIAAVAAVISALPYIISLVS